MVGGVMRSSEFDSTHLSRLQSQLTAWRDRQSGRARLPESLWQAAAVLARRHRHGVSRVSRSLGIGFWKLRQWVAKEDSLPASRSKVAPPRPTAPSGFVEFQLPPALYGWITPTAKMGAIEVSDASLRKLRIELPTDPDAGFEPAPAWLAQDRIQGGCGGKRLKEQRAALIQYTEQPIRQGRIDSPWEGVAAGVVLGEPSWVPRNRFWAGLGLR